MTSRHTWFWLFLAAGLFAAVVVHRHTRKPPAGPGRVLPNFKSAAISSVEILPRGQPQIQAVRTNGAWQLVQPLRYPAQSVSIESLLAALEGLTPAPFISERELADRYRADEQFGFSDPQATILVDGIRLRLGHKTPPGDQIFLQIVGGEGIYAVDADLLKLVPRRVNEWRDTTLVNLKGAVIDRVAVTNLTKSFGLQRDSTNHFWRMIWPQSARADNARIEDYLQRLQSLRIQQFVTDDTNVDAETYGLAPAELELALAQGTNAAVILQFGNSPTNDAGEVYARRLGQTAIVTVAKELLTPWQAQVNDFRDPHLFTLTERVEAIEVRGQDSFSLQRKTNDSWLILPQNLPADAQVVNGLMVSLSSIRIVDYVKEVVSPPALPDYGLAVPALRFILSTSASNSVSRSNETVAADLSFGIGTNSPTSVYARRADESSVYAINTNDFLRLPSVSWKMRERKLWGFSESNIVRAIIRQGGKVRELVRKDRYEWGLAPGSQGVIDNQQQIAVEETVRMIAQLTAPEWVAHGAQERARGGFVEDGLQITLELNNGNKATLEFGGTAPSGCPYAAVSLEGDVWIFEFPAGLYRYVDAYLSLPPAP